MFTSICGLKGLSTLSSIVSNLVSKIPSINLGLDEVERSANFCRNREGGFRNQPLRE